MAENGISARRLIEVEDKINSSPEEQSAFIENPRAYLEKSGVSLPEEYQADLERNISEMAAGPASFRELASMSNRMAGIMISIRIPF